MNFDIEICNENICRTCLNKDPVFEISQEILEKLKICGGIDTPKNEKDMFPNKICHKCFVNLEISYEFWRICQQSDKKLKEVEITRNAVVNFDNDTILGNMKVELLSPKDERDYVDIKEEYIVNNQINFNIDLDSDSEEFVENSGSVENQMRNKEKLRCKTVEFISTESKGKVKRKYTKKVKDNKINKIKNSGELHTCEFCGINYVSKFSMENHMRLHSARLRFVCEICGDSYAGKFQLEQHMCSKHTGERNFKCGHCDKAFFSKTLRNKHEKRSHSKLFKCDQCDKSFGRSDSLRKHMRVHTGEKPVVCDKCGTRFKELHHLKNHNKSMTPCILKMSIKVKDI